MLIEEIAELVGHSSTHTTETVYRRQLTPVLRGGAVTMALDLRRNGSCGR